MKKGQGGNMDELEELARRRVGSVLRDRYRVEELLGMGGMAAVFRGSHRNGHRVAIKVLHPDLAKSKEICSRFLKEGYVANAVDHPNAVRVIDDDTASDGAAFLVMELLEGQTVDARRESVPGRKLPLAEVAKIAHDVLDVLVAAHAKGIIHRDLKPENLFLTKTNQLKILDFGIARMRDGAGTSWTRSGHAMGTPAYMPPEQAMGLTREIDGRTDLWAVGATMFSLLTGDFVHEAETVQQLLIFAATQHARSIRAVAPDLAPPFVTLIDRALAYDKNRRFADATEMLEAVDEAYRVTFGQNLPGASTPRERPLGLADTRMDPQAQEETIHVNSAPAVAPTLDSASLKNPLPKTIDATVPPATTDAAPLTEISRTEPGGQPPNVATELAAPLAAPRMASTTAGLSTGVITGEQPHVPVDSTANESPKGRYGMLAGIAGAMLLLGGVLAGGVIKLAGGAASDAGVESSGVVASPPPPVQAAPPLVLTTASTVTASAAPAPAPASKPTPLPAVAPPQPTPPRVAPAASTTTPPPPPGPPADCKGEGRFYYPDPKNPELRLTRPECKK
jgi:serine/threonine-protein kinase